MHRANAPRTRTDPGGAERVLTPTHLLAYARTRKCARAQHTRACTHARPPARTGDRRGRARARGRGLRRRRREGGPQGREEGGQARGEGGQEGQGGGEEGEGRLQRAGLARGEEGEGEARDRGLQADTRNACACVCVCVRVHVHATDVTRYTVTDVHIYMH